jgi:hypothetical protein
MIVAQFIPGFATHSATLLTVYTMRSVVDVSDTPLDVINPSSPDLIPT